MKYKSISLKKDSPHSLMWWNVVIDVGILIMQVGVRRSMLLQSLKRKGTDIVVVFFGF